MIIKVTIDSQTYDVEVGDLQDCPVIATIEGEVFEVWPAEPSTTALEAPVVAVQPSRAPAPSQPSAAPAAPKPTPSAGKNKSKLVTAPIPGVIISVGVKPGDQVVFGQELCILEAMKMKNAIRAAHPGEIASVAINAGDTVKHGQTLMEFKE